MTAPPPSAAATATAAAAAEAETIIGRLADILAAETAALAAGRREDVARLTAEKIAACRAYEGLMKMVAADGGSLAALDADRRTRLRHLGDGIAALARDNARRLEIAVAAHRRFMDTIAEAARSLAPGAGTYSPTGGVGRGRTARAPAPIAVSLDRSL
ncbi:MAG: hypothetical protein ACFCUO_10510 [Rhodospirillales bacterium]